MNQDEFLERVKKIAAKDTSFDQLNWSSDNPLFGHCTVVSLLTQDYFGGDLIRGSLEEIPRFAYMKSHYWNKLADGSEVDFTRDQFGGEIKFINTEIRDSKIMSSAECLSEYISLGYKDSS